MKWFGSLCFYYAAHSVRDFNRYKQRQCEEGEKLLQQKKDWGTLLCHAWTVCVCQCVCFYSRWTQMKQCSQWLSTYSLTEPPLSPLISPMSLRSPQMHSSIIRSQITVILQGWEMTKLHTHTHTHTHTLQTAFKIQSTFLKNIACEALGPFVSVFSNSCPLIFSVQHLFIKLCLLQSFQHCDKWTQRGN